MVRTKEVVQSLHRPLLLVTLGSVALLGAALLLQFLDGRLVTGAPVWLKPAKFAASVALMGAPLAWIIAQMQGGPARRARRVRAAGTVIAVVAALELAIITVQAARGVPSHFNASTPLDGALFTIMGAAITLLWLAELVVAWAAFRHRFATPARTWGIRLGLAGSLLGGAFGFLMTRPTPAQVESLRAGHPPSALGGHAVGVADGGPGLPVTRWSTEGGDLRAPHFFGLHALQVLPLAALFLERRRRSPASSSSASWSSRSARPILALGTAYLGLTLVTLVQALRAQPLFGPDAPTFASAAAVLAVVLGVAFLPRPFARAARSSIDTPSSDGMLARPGDKQRWMQGSRV